ncbi:MAG: DNA primase [Clostridia bacterium]|nr:DNA primase [Clostridia bacterium]
MSVIRLSDEFLSEIRYRNRIEDVISSYVNLKRTGNTMKGLCPFHNEKTPSFTVYPENGSYYCFGCQNGGDVITFIRNAENLDYIEAVKYLADRSGMSMPESGYDDSAEKMRKTLLEINRETARFYHSCLIDPKIGKRGLDYFYQRQLTPTTIKKFGLGFAPDGFYNLVNHLKSLGYKENDMILANVAGRGKNGGAYDRFRGKVMFPIIDLRGNVVGFGGRKLPGDEGAKYINTSDTPVYKKTKNMYAMNLAKNSKSESIILCEGYMDVIALHQAGFTNAVAALGTAFTEDQATLISKYAKEVIITMDSDEAGQKASKRAIDIVNKTGLKIRVLQIEGGKDPDEYIKTYGAERFKLLLEGAKNDIEFNLFSAKAKYDTDTDAGRLQYLNDAVEILAGVNNEIAQNIYAGRLSDELSVDKQVLTNRIKALYKKRAGARQKEQLREMTSPTVRRDDINPEAVRHKRAAAAEEIIISILMLNPELCTTAFEQLSEEEFITSFNRRLYKALKTALSTSKAFDITMISSEFSPAEMGRIVLIQNKATVYKDSRRELNDCIAVLKEENNKLQKIDSSNMDNDEFAKAMQKIAKNKK